MQIGTGALNRRRSVVPAEPTNNARVDAVTVPDLHVVITARMVKLQTQHHEPVGKKTKHNKCEVTGG